MSDGYAPIITSDEWNAHQASLWATETDKRLSAITSGAWDLEADQRIASLSSLPSLSTLESYAGNELRDQAGPAAPVAPPPTTPTAPPTVAPPEAVAPADWSTQADARIASLGADDEGLMASVPPAAAQSFADFMAQHEQPRGIDFMAPTYGRPEPQGEDPTPRGRVGGALLGALQGVGEAVGRTATGARRLLTTDAIPRAIEGAGRYLAEGMVGDGADVTGMSGAGMRTTMAPARGARNEGMLPDLTEDVDLGRMAETAGDVANVIPAWQGANAGFSALRGALVGSGVVDDDSPLADLAALGLQFGGPGALRAGARLAGPLLEDALRTLPRFGEAAGRELASAARTAPALAPKAGAATDLGALFESIYGSPTGMERAVDLAGAAAGGAGGVLTADDDATLGERAGRGVVGASLGALGARQLRGAAGLARRVNDAGMAAVREGPLGIVPDLPPLGVRSLGKAVERLASDEIPDLAAPIVKSAEEEVERLRLDKFPEDVRPLIQDAAERMGFATGQRRGVISDAAAEEMADDLGRTTEQWLRTGKAGRAYNTEELRALTNGITTQASRVRELGLEVAKPGADNTQAIASLIVEGDKLAALTALREGAKAEAGRALRAFRQEARMAADPNDAISRIFAKVGGAERAREMASQYATMVEQGADPIQMAHFWGQVENPKVTFGDWFRALRYNSMLSGPRSMEVDLVGTGAEVPWKLARDTFASLGRAAATRSSEPLRELVPELAGVWTGAVKGGGAMLEALGHGITNERALAGDLPHDMISRLDNPAAKAAAWSLEWVTRFKGGINEFQHQVAYGMSYGRLAGRQATREGLTGQAWATRVSELTANPTELPALARQAMSDADRLVYANDLGQQGRNVAEFRKKGGILGHIVMPFYPTIYNITARGIDRSPLGLVGTAVDVARGKYGRGGALGGLVGKGAFSGETMAGAEKGLRPLGERMGDNVMGSAIFAWFYAKAAEGTISASGPANTQERDVLRAQGWQPYSVKLGDEWVSYANWGPAAVTLATAAGAAEAGTYRAPKPGATDVLSDGLRRSLEVFTEQTYLSSVGAIYKAIREPDRYGGQWINSFMTSLVPEGSLINTIGQAGDEANRQITPGMSAESTADAFKSRVPGLRQQLPVKRTALGDVEPNPYYGGRSVLPVRVSTPPNPATANVRRFQGSASAAQDYQIAQAITRVNNWRNRPKEFERPTQAEMDLAKRFSGRENPRYQKLISDAAARERRDRLARPGR